MDFPKTFRLHGTTHTSGNLKGLCLGTRTGRESIFDALRSLQSELAVCNLARR